MPLKEKKKNAFGWILSFLELSMMFSPNVTVFVAGLYAALHPKRHTRVNKPISPLLIIFRANKLTGLLNDVPYLMEMCNKNTSRGGYRILVGGPAEF